MRVIVGCERFGRVAKAFRDRGHEAYSCDILPAEHSMGFHIQDDILKHLRDGWDLGIFHPDCTYLANSGVRWLIGDEERMALMTNACKFFNTLLDAPIKRIAVENPIQHKYARALIRKYDQIVQPYWFGEGESKATCLWLVNLPKLVPTNMVSGRFGRVWREPPSPDRQGKRSITYQGIADAMAAQWGGAN